jgi:ActR/RegA family two-component response regulator
MEAISHRDRPAPLALIVDDEALLALEIEDLLMAEGFRTLIAYTEAEVTTLAVEHLAVAVIDLSLGGELSGQRVIRFLRNRIPKLPVVVVTGYANQAPQANLRGLGWPTIRLHKPARHEQLACAVWDVIDQASHGAPPPNGRRRDDAGRAA